MNDWRGILWEMVSSEPNTAKESKTHRSGVYMHKIRPAKILSRRPVLSPLHTEKFLSES